MENLSQHLFAIRAVANLSAVFLANTASDLTSIASLSKSEKTQQTVVQKTGRQIIKTIFFSEDKLILTRWEATIFLFLAG